MGKLLPISAIINHADEEVGSGGFHHPYPPSGSGSDESGGSASGSRPASSGSANSRATSSVGDRRETTSEMMSQSSSSAASRAASACGSSSASYCMPSPDGVAAQQQTRGRDDDYNDVTDVTDNEMNGHESVAASDSSSDSQSVINVAAGPAPVANMAAATETSAVADSSEEEHEIENIVSHHVDQELSLVDFCVEWKDVGPSIESERWLQLQVPSLVYKYWADRGGRQIATGLDEYHVFKILKRRQRSPCFLVQWVGYRATASDTTWETGEFLRDVAPSAMADFETMEAAAAAIKAANPAADAKAATPKKRGIARATGKKCKKQRIV